MIGRRRRVALRFVQEASSLPAITWLGHATTLLELDGVRLLTDPVLGDRVGPLVRISNPVAADAVGQIDAVLLSHLHADHADRPSLRRLARTAVVVAPSGSAAWLRRAGALEVRELRPGQATSLGRVDIRALPAVHDRRRRPLGAQATPIGYLIRGSASVYFAGDTDLFDEMADLRGLIDVALLPVWGWGPRVGPGHLDPERAARAAAMIAPRMAVPIHWGTFALARPARRSSDPRWPPREFGTLTRRYAPGVEVRILDPGERLQFTS